MSQNPDLAAIRGLAESLIDSPCHFILGTEAKHLQGGQYFVYPLQDRSNRRICIRIPQNTTDPHTRLLIACEAEIRRRIDAARISPFQPLLRFDSGIDNQLHKPFMALGWADGTSLTWSDTCPAVESKRKQVIHAVANASLDLISILQPGKSALDWITLKIDRKIVRAKAGKLPGGTVAECVQQMELTQKYWVPELDAAPHVLIHGDLSNNNIIVDDQYKVQSIIDLGWAEFVPLQFAAVYPRFLTHEPSFNNWGGRDTERMKLDRALYLECIRERAVQERGMMLDYLKVLSRQDEISRYWWLCAASRIDIHRAMSSCSWVPPIQTHYVTE